MIGYMMQNYRSKGLKCFDKIGRCVKVEVSLYIRDSLVTSAIKLGNAFPGIINC